MGVHGTTLSIAHRPVLTSTIMVESEVEMGDAVMLIAERLIHRRIERGFMPANLEQLLERRGTLEQAATDLADFSSIPYQECLEGLRRVYHDQLY